MLAYLLDHFQPPIRSQIAHSLHKGRHLELDFFQRVPNDSNISQDMLLTEIAPFLVPISLKPGKTQSVSSIDISTNLPQNELIYDDYGAFVEIPGPTRKRKIDSSILWSEGDKSDAIYFVLQGLIGLHNLLIFLIRNLLIFSNSLFSSTLLIISDKSFLYVS
jgi:hypothetical protein